MKTHVLSRVFRLSAALAAAALMMAVCSTIAAPARGNGFGMSSQTGAPLPPKGAPEVPALSTEPSFSGRFDVGGYKLSIMCFGAAQPTVILDSDLVWASDEWYSVVPGVSALTRVCIYDRAGLGRSDKAIGPRTSQQMATDLHKLLAAAHIEPPYVLAGHGVGADNVRVFQQQWPADVAALVMIGANPPDYATRQKNALPNTLGVYPQDLLRILAWLNLPETNISREAYDAAVSREQVRACGRLGSLPLWVLAQVPVNGAQWLGFTQSSSAEVVDTLLTQWNAMQRELAAISDNSMLLMASTFGHDLPIEDPDLVTSVIAETVSAVRATEKTGR